MRLYAKSNILTYRSAIELTSIFVKFADSSKLLQTLNALPVSQDVIDYILSLPKQYVGFAVGKIKKEPATDLHTLRTFIDQIKEKENIKNQTQEEIASQLPEALKNSQYKNWFTIQFKKYPEKSKIVSDHIAELLIKFITVYSVNLSSYNLPDLLVDMDNELGDTSGLDDGIGSFFQKIKDMEIEQATRYLRVHDGPLFNWLSHSFFKLRKEWRKKIEKYMKDHYKNFNQILGEAQAILQAQQAGELRGQEMPDNPLHFPEHAALINNLENVVHWYNATAGDFDPSWSVSRVLDLSAQWQHEEAAAGAGKKYDPIDPSRIVYGPDNWSNPEFKGYFILELKSHNDLKTEGFKMNHCVGGYCDVVDRGTSRVFSLRHVSSPLEPILTIETNPNMKVVRQDYGPNNSKVDKKFHDMVNEWNAENLGDVDPSTLSIDDLTELVYQSKALPRKVIEYILTSLYDDDIVRVLASRCKNLLPEDFMALSNHPDPGIRIAVAENSEISEAAALNLAKDKLYAVRDALAGNHSITSPEVLSTLLNDSSVARTLSRHPNLTKEMIQALLEKSFNSKNKDVKAIVFEIADNPNLDEDTIRKLFNMNEEIFPIKLLNNPNLPVDIMEQAITWNNYETEERLAGNPNAPAHILDKIADLYLEENPTSNVVTNIVTNPSVSSQTIDKIFNAIKPMNSLLDYGSANRDLMGIIAREAKTTSTETLNQILDLAKKSNDRYLVEDVEASLRQKAREQQNVAAAFNTLRLVKFADKFAAKVKQQFASKR